MPSLHAEVTGLYDRAGDANHLLYTPLARSLTARETRRYTVEYDGDGAALTAFLAKVLADRVSHELTTGDAPKFTGSSFILDYGMKGGALDLEKETILAHHRGDTNPPFTIQSLRINRRIYIFDPAKQADTPQLADRFVRDIVNPAIHTWKVTPGTEADALVAAAPVAEPAAVVASVETPAADDTPAPETTSEAAATVPETTAAEVAAPTEVPAEKPETPVAEPVTPDAPPTADIPATESAPVAEVAVASEVRPAEGECSGPPGACESAPVGEEGPAERPAV